MQTGTPRLEQLLDAAVARHPDRPALVHAGRVWRYAAFRAEADRRAALIAGAGIAPGAVVVAVERFTDDVLLALFACARADVALLRLPTGLPPTEIASLVARAGAACALTPDGAPLPACPHLPALPFAPPCEPDAVARAEVRRRSAHGTPEATLTLQPTSGTTGGTAKLVRQPHRQLTWAAAHRHWWEEPGGTVLFAFSDHFPTRGATRTLHIGGTIALTPTLDPVRLEAEMVTRRATGLFTLPAVARLIAENPRPSPPGLRIGVVRTGAAPLPAAVADALARRYPGCVIAQEYSSSEGGTMLHSRPDTPHGSIGRPLPGVVVRIVDESGADVPEGAAGELVVHTPGAMLGYLGEPAVTARTLHDGWLRTGDVARRDAGGNYYLIGRVRLWINVAGAKVSPEEVEAVLEQHPAVREAVVLAAPDAARGEVVRAILVPRGAPPTASELRRFCRERLAAYKVPRVIEFRDDLPRSAAGKPLRHLI